MKKLFLITTVLIAGHGMQAQQPFSPAGAVWHYNFTIIGSPAFGFTRISYTGDTLINGVTAKILAGTIYTFLPPDSLISSNPVQKQFIYQNGDTVSRYQNGSWLTWFNFGAQTGDQWVLDYTTTMPLCDPFSVLQVTATGNTIVNGETLRWINADTVGYSPFGYHGQIRERIGPVGFNNLLPSEQNCDSTIIADFFVVSFACYEDSAFSLINATPYPCGYWLYTGMEEPERYSLEITPNPSAGHIKIKTSGGAGMKELILYNLLGEVVFESPIDSDQLEIVLPVETGIYFAEAKGNNQRSVQKIIVRK